ncbi:MAG TPA: zf-HC2 domain-containing protein [Ktedonobacterales bacterium]
MSDHPMRCGDAAPYLSAYSDGELEESLRVRVAAHIEGCAQCEAEVRRYAAIDDLIGTLPHSTPSPEVLDRVLAARRAPGPVTRESLLRRPKLLAPRSLPPLLRMHGNSPAVVRPIARSGRVRPPSIAARAIPVLAAALLIALSVFAFSRFPLADRLRGNRPVATPQSVASVLAETQRQVSAKRSALGFTPIVPTYLPPNTTLQHVTVGNEPSDGALRYLDMSWALAFPLTTLHIRESALPLDKRDDFSPGARNDPGMAELAWNLGPYQWVRGLVKGAPGRCAVGESRPGLSIAADVATASVGATCDTSNFAAINVLRLASLSLDAPYSPLTVLAPDSAQKVLHFTAYKTVPNGASWDVYADPAHQRVSITALDQHGTRLYTDLIGADGGVTRIDPQTGHYQALPASAAAGEPARLTTSVATFFTTANTLLGSGELWNMGLTDVPKGLTSAGRAYKLVQVDAPYPTTIYVDLTTKQLLGAQVDYQSSQHPGGAHASSKLTPANSCPSYASIQYVALSAVPASTFAPPEGYTKGAIAVTPITC